MDERPLSERLRDKCEADGITPAQASAAMGQPANFVARAIDLSVIPGPKKFQALARWLGVSEFEVGGAVALDLLERSRREEMFRSP